MKKAIFIALITLTATVWAAAQGIGSKPDSNTAFNSGN